MTVSIPLIVTFVVYLVAMIGIGFWAWRSTRDFDDYILGGRSLGGFVTAMSAGASDMSGWLLMGLPGALYLTGVSEAWIAIGLIAGAWLNWRYVAGPLRLYTERTENALTLPDYFTHRFADGSRMLRILSALVILVFFTVYCASGIVAGAKLFQSVFGVSYGTAMWLGAGATILYTFIGGFLAVSWTDTVQATLMIFALLLTPVMAIISIGGPGDAVAMIEQVDPSRLQWIGAGGVLAVISAAAWGLGYFGQPHILARFMAAESLRTIPTARRISITWMALCLSGAVIMGLAGIAYYSVHPQSIDLNGKDNAERVFIALAQDILNPWLAGVVLSAILAAIMSTLSCQLLVCSSALTEDFYRGLFRRGAGQSELIWFGRIMVLIVALVAIYLARNPRSQVLDLVSYAWAGFGAAFGPVVILSLFWKRMTRNGALAGVLVGALVVIGWKLAHDHFATLHQADPTLTGIPEWLKLYEIVPGFVGASLAIVVVSLLGRAPAHQVRDTFEAVRADLRESGY